MGSTACTCGSSRPCGGAKDDAPKGGAEYEPVQGAASDEQEDLAGGKDMPNGWRQAQTPYSPPAAYLEPGGGQRLGPMQPHVGERSPETLAPRRPPSGDHFGAGHPSPRVQSGSSPARPQRQPSGGTPLSGRAADAKAAAMSRLMAALDKQPQSPREIEAAVREADQACVQEQEVQDAKRQLMVLRVLQRMSLAAADGDADRLSEAINKACDIGAPPEEITKAKEALVKVRETQRRLQEEERRKNEEKRKQEDEADRMLSEAVAALQKAVADKDAAKLKVAIDNASKLPVPAAELDAAKQVLAELEKAGQKKRGLFSRK